MSVEDIRVAVYGRDRGFQVIDGGKPPPPGRAAEDGCPVTPLGHRDGMWHFLDARGQHRALSSRQLGARHDLVGLFCGDDAWLRDKFPKRIERDGEEITVDFVINAAAKRLQQACAGAGLYGEHVEPRKPGVWPPAGPAGSAIPVVHCGDVVLLDGIAHPPGRIGGVVWAAAPPTARPDTPCAAAIARELQEDLRLLWRFAAPGGEIAVLGLLGAGLLGAAPPWRPSGFLTGGTASGKSALVAVLRGAAPLHHYTNDTSKAGVEQAVDGRAMLILIDEASDRQNRDAGRALLDLVLSASGGEGTKGYRGGVDGRARRIELAGSVIMSAIAPPELAPQHLGRFTLVELRQPEAGADHEAQHRALAARIRLWGRALWGRMLAGWERYLASLKAFRAALARAGCAPREMDQVSALLAAWHVLTDEGEPSERRAAEGVAALAAFVRSPLVVAEDDGPRRVLDFLLSTPIQLDRSTDREPVGNLIAMVLANDPQARLLPDTAKRALGQIGIRVVGTGEVEDHRHRPVPRAGEGAGIWLWPTAAPLAALFARSAHEGGRWLWELNRLDGAHVRHTGKVRIGEQTPRGCLWLPLRHLRLSIDRGEAEGE